MSIEKKFAQKSSGFADWAFREYNELPHSFNERMELTKRTANIIVNSVDNTPISDAIRKCIKYVLKEYLI